MIVMPWRAGLQISEALALNETHLDPDRRHLSHPLIAEAIASTSEL